MKETKEKQLTAPLTDKEKSLMVMAFNQREDEWKHLSYADELRFYQAVRDGNLTYISGRVKGINFDNQGHLSDNKCRNYQYHFACGITMITRFCIQGGMESQDAYNLSDYYIQCADVLTVPEEVLELYKNMIIDFTTRMQHLSKAKPHYSKPISEAADYIYQHLHESISLEELSEQVGLSPSYFSTLFKKETGLSPATYIRNKKIETAKNMLRYSEYSYSEISNILAFNTHSHFISTFKSIVGMTPKEYRDTYYRTNWQG